MAALLEAREFCTDRHPVHIADRRLTGHLTTEPHYHDFYEFFYIVRGKLRHHANGAVYEMSQGDLCLVAPQDSHAFQKHPEVDDVLFTNVAFRAECFYQTAEFLALTPSRPRDGRPWVLTPCNPAVLGRVASTVGRLRTDTSLTPAEHMLQLKGMLVEVLTALIEADRHRAADPHADAPSWLRRALREMQDTDNLVSGVSRLVALCGKSQEHISRTMRRYYRTSPTEYVNRARLTRAARLLRDTDQPVLSVILATGFNNVSHFLTLFKRRYACTPRQYRKKHMMVIDGRR